MYMFRWMNVTQPDNIIWVANIPKSITASVCSDSIDLNESPLILQSIWKIKAHLWMEIYHWTITISNITTLFIHSSIPSQKVALSLSESAKTDGKKPVKMSGYGVLSLSNLHCWKTIKTFYFEPKLVGPHVGTTMTSYLKFLPNILI